ncbi:MAG: hypothetical protein HQL62_08835 [Magnetococcales bacterium]|nr:hypothetical protein [Magnetococcales bacterium]
MERFVLYRRTCVTCALRNSHHGHRACEERVLQAGLGSVIEGPFRAWVCLAHAALFIGGE